MTGIHGTYYLCRRKNGWLTGTMLNFHDIRGARFPIEVTVNLRLLSFNYHTNRWSMVSQRINRDHVVAVFQASKQQVEPGFLQN